MQRGNITKRRLNCLQSRCASLERRVKKLEAHLNETTITYNSELPSGLSKQEQREALANELKDVLVNLWTETRLRKGPPSPGQP